MRDEITVCLLRHGKTPGNIKRGYIGCRTDEDLSETGIRELETYAREGRYPKADIVFLSPMKRCRQTAKIVWPDLIFGGKYETVQDLRECDFGDFDGKSYSELSGVPDFQHWVDSDGMGAFPGGEDPRDFQKRSTDAFLCAMDAILLIPSIHSAAFAVHGGTIMSIMNSLTTPAQKRERRRVSGRPDQGEAGNGYYDWHVTNGDGFCAAVSREEWERTHRFSLVRSILPVEEVE